MARATAGARIFHRVPAGTLRVAWAVVAALLVSSVANASAQLPTQLRVRWTSTSCLRGGEFDRELTRLLGDAANAIEPSEIEVQIQASGGDEGPAYVLRLQLDVAAGRSERTLSLASCADARHAAALLIGTALEQGRATRPPASDEAAAQVPRAWHVQLGLLGDFGTLPELSGGPDAQVGWERAGLRLRAAAHYFFARDVADNDSQLVAAIDQLAGALGAAYLWSLGPLRLGPTVDAELGMLRARARGEEGRPTKSARWGAALLGLGAELPTSERLTFALSVQASVPVWRPSFSLIDEMAFHETAVVGFRAGLGVRVRLGFKNEPARGQ